MSIFDGQTSIINQRRAIGSYVAITEPVKITNGIGSLRENPNFAAGVVIKNGATTYSICNFNKGQQPATGVISIDYDQAIIYGLADVEGLTLTVSYQGMGAIFLNVSRIATNVTGGVVTQTLGDVVTKASSFKYLNSYDSATVYSIFNIVTYNGTSYICNATTSLGNLPTNTAFWGKLAGNNFQGTYSSGTTYINGDTVLNAIGDTIYVSVIDGNIGQSLTNTAKWTPTISVASMTAAEASRVTAENSRVTAESGRVSAETGRTSTESTRVSNESTRQTNETGRTSAESSRVTVEGNRVTAESGRASAESTRVSSETTRGTNESTRQTNETNRGTAETSRVNAESSRVTVESNRVTAESGRTSAENTRATNETTRGTNETNRGTAETGRVNAESTRVSSETTRGNNETARIGRDTAYQLLEAYNNAHAYVALNKVTYNGSCYQCILATTGNIPTNTTYWTQISAAGSVASVTSANSDISVTNPTTSPQLTANTGIGANQLGKRDVNGNLPNIGMQSISISANTTLTPAQNGVILVTTAASTIATTLPTAVGNAQLSYIFKKVDGGLGSVNILTTSSQLIDGVSSKSINYQNGYIQVVSDGTGWQIVDGSTNVSSTNADISVSSGLNNPALTLNSSVTPTPSSIVKRDPSGFITNITDSPATTLLNLGYGLQVLNVTKGAPYNVLNILGRTLVNLVGRDGNCEDISKWSPSTSTLALDTANKTIGSNSIKITNTSSAGAMLRSVTYYANKYYVVVADLKNGNSTTGMRIRNNTVNSPTITDTTKFTTTGFRFNSATDYNDYIVIDVQGANTQYAYVDAIRMYEVSLTDYNAFTGLTSDQLNAKYPYVDDVKHVNAPYIIRYGENLLPTFNEYTTSGNVSITDPYAATISAVGTTQEYLLCNVSVVVGQQYTVTGKNIRVNDGASNNILAFIGNAVTSATFTTTSSLISVVVSNTTSATTGTTTFACSAGTYSVTNPRLNIGAVDKGFKPRNDDYLFFPNTAIASSVDGTVFDQIFRRDGKFWRENRFSRDNILDGSLVWGYNSFATGIKRVVTTFSPKPWVNYTGNVVKYDGKILNNNGSSSVIANADSYLIWTAGELYLDISSVDSGWGDSYTPTAGEIQAYFYGWQMLDASGSVYSSGTKRWTAKWSTGWAWNPSSEDNFNTGTVPTKLAPSGYKNYKLTYQLANSYSEEIPFEGSISTLEGGNQFEVGNGMIVREKVNPTYDSNGSAINNTIYPTTLLKNRTNRLLQVFKDSRVDNTWTLQTNNVNGNGGGKAFSMNYVQNSPSTYEVSYLALDEYLLSANVQTINGEYDSNIKMVVDRLAQNQADIDTRVSIMENNKARKVQGQWIAPTLLNGWINPVGGDFIAGYYKDEFNIVRVKGLIRNGVVTAGTVLFTLPSGYRPLAVDSTNLGSYNGTSYIPFAININPNGNVNIAGIAPGNTYIILDFTFLAEQ